MSDMIKIHANFLQMVLKRKTSKVRKSSFMSNEFYEGFIESLMKQLAKQNCNLTEETDLKNEISDLNNKLQEKSAELIETQKQLKIARDKIQKNENLDSPKKCTKRKRMADPNLRFKCPSCLTIVTGRMDNFRRHLRGCPLFLVFAERKGINIEQLNLVNIDILHTPKYECL